MNIQDTILELGLDKKTLPRILAQRVATVENLVSKIELAENEVEDDPTEENTAKLEEIKEYTEEYFKDAQDQLRSYKNQLEKKANENGEVKPVVDEEKKSSGMGTLLIGGVILVATLGAINIFNKR